MAVYFIECYWPGVDERRLGEVIQRLTSTPGGDIAWLGSILVPDDEIVLGLASGPSPEAIRVTAREAGLPAERVVACIQIPSSRKETRCM